MIHGLIGLYCFQVAVLCHLQHPCVVKLLGVCLHPLCFILEIAPQGSLANVLEDITLGREKEKKGINPVKYETKDSVLGRALTYKMAYQVSEKMLCELTWLSANV